MDADDAHPALTAVHGIGPWTADIYLLFCLGHADAWPAGDLAVQEAAPHRLRPREAPGRQGDDRWPSPGARGAAWRRLLWAYYRAVKTSATRRPVASSMAPQSKRVRRTQHAKT